MGLGKFTEDATVIPRATLRQMTVQFAVESVSSLPWNHCPVCCGIRKTDLRDKDEQGLPVVTNHDMGQAFEELLRKFNDVSPAGEQYTPTTTGKTQKFSLCAHAGLPAAERLACVPQ